MKSLMSLMQVVLEDMSTLCSVDTNRDLTTIAVRYKHEGDAFFGITLADFGKSFERAIDRGQISDTDFLGFKRVRGLPAFLQGFLRLVFDPIHGALLDEPSHSAIYAVRQITLMWAKIERPCTDARNRKAVNAYIQTEQDVKSFTKRYRYDLTARSSFRRMAGLLFGDLFWALSKDVDEGIMLPSHGPGMTADRRQGNQKWLPETWSSRVEKVYPMDTHLIPNHWHHEVLEGVNVLRPEQEIPVQVTLVPKTMKTPRIIAEEPTHVMYVQKALQNRWYDLFDNGEVLSSAFIQYRKESQELNRELARTGSVNGELATLDLSEASDRVSIAHVADLLHSFPSLREAVFAARSTCARTPTGEVIRLWKYASMGSALTFPLESAVFLTVVFLGIQKALNKPLSHPDIRQLRGRVRIFGDDIIVPKDYASSVVSTLESYGFKVNHNKSFWTGKFRESCGGDYYGGDDVSIIKLRTEIPNSRQNVEEIVSLVDFRNQMYKSLNWTTARWCDRRITRILRYFPAVADTSPALGRSSLLGYDTEKIHERLHSPRVRAWVMRTPLPDNSVDGVAALSKVLFYSASQDPDRDHDPMSKDHLQRSGRPKSAALQLGWKVPF